MLGEPWPVDRHEGEIATSQRAACGHTIIGSHFRGRRLARHVRCHPYLVADRVRRSIGSGELRKLAAAKLAQERPGAVDRGQRLNRGRA